MQIISEAQKEVISMREAKRGSGQTKSKLRVDLESLEIGQSAIFIKGVDYPSYKNFYTIVKGINRTSNFRFEFGETSDYRGVVATRTQ